MSSHHSTITTTLAAAAILVTLIGCHQTKPTSASGPQKVTITGKILTARGTAPLAAAARLLVPGSKDVTAVAAPDGSFTIEAPPKTAMRLRLSAVDHVEANLPVFFETTAPASVTVKLGVDPFDRTAHTVKIAASETKDFSLHDAVPMHRQPDGTFVWEKDTTAPEIRYELLGITTNGHSVNGTQSDGFADDGGGDFESIVHPANGHVRIVYDPSKLPAPVPGQFPDVSWDTAHASLDTLATLDRTFTVTTKRVMAAAWAYNQQHHDLKGFHADDGALITSLTTTMAHDTSPLVRAYAALLLLNTRASLEEPIKVSPDFITSILATAPPSSPAWALRPRSIEALDTLGGNQVQVVFHRFVTGNASKQVQAYALYSEALRAKLKHDTALQRKDYERLKSDYIGVPGITYKLTEINPDKAIQVGKPVPAFSTTLLNGHKITNKDLLGHYTLLDFWATWCPPCRAEMPNLDAAWKKFHRQNFQIVSLSFDESPKAIATFRKGKWKMPWKHVFVKGGFRSSLAKTFEVEGIPSPILVGPDGTILALEPATRGPTLLNTIAAVLSKAHAHTK